MKVLCLLFNERRVKPTSLPTPPPYTLTDVSLGIDGLPNVHESQTSYVR